MIVTPCIRMSLQGWHYWNDSCYLLQPIKQSWQSATEICRDVKATGHIAVVNSVQEQLFLAQLVPASWGNVWLGCNSIDTGGVTWTCPDSSGMSYDENTKISSPNSYWSKYLFCFTLSCTGIPSLSETVLLSWIIDLDGLWLNLLLEYSWSNV